MAQRTFMQKRVAVPCTGCGKMHGTPENYPGWFECKTYGMWVAWRDVHDKAIPLEPRRVLDF